MYLCTEYMTQVSKQNISLSLKPVSGTVHGASKPLRDVYCRLADFPSQEANTIQRILLNCLNLRCVVSLRIDTHRNVHTAQVSKQNILSLKRGDWNGASETVKHR